MVQGSTTEPPLWALSLSFIVSLGVLDPENGVTLRRLSQVSEPSSGGASPSEQLREQEGPASPGATGSLTCSFPLSCVLGPVWEIVGSAEKLCPWSQRRAKPNHTDIRPRRQGLLRNGLFLAEATGSGPLARQSAPWAALVPLTSGRAGPGPCSRNWTGRRRCSFPIRQTPSPGKPRNE